MKPLDKYDQLLEEELNHLKVEYDNYKTKIDCVTVLTFSKDDQNQYVLNLLDNQELLLTTFPQLIDQFKILTFFRKNNALELEQVKIAINNILEDEQVKNTIINQSNYQNLVKRIQEQIEELNNASISSKASFILKINIDDEEKVNILTQLAYESCQNASLKQQKPKEKTKEELKEEKIEPETLFEERDEAKIENINNKYFAIKPQIENLLNQYYYLINGKSIGTLEYTKQLVDIAKVQKEKDSLDLKSLNLDEFSYKEVSMTMLILDIIEAKQELEKNLQNPASKQDDIEYYFNALKETYSKALILGEAITKDNLEKTKKTDDIYFLLDENNTPFFQLEKFNKEERKRCLSLMEKFKKHIYDYEKGKTHTKLKSKKKINDIYINKSSTMCVSYIRAKDNQVLILTFAHLNEIYDDSTRIDQNYAYLIKETLDNINTKNSSFIEQQYQFSEQFKDQIFSKGDDPK